MSMDDIITVAARVAHEANRALQIIQNEEFISPSWDEAPAEIQKSAYDGVTRVFNDPEVTPEQLHESWLEFKVANGWTYGPERIDELKQHPCMVPYSELPEAQRNKDLMFRAVVKATLGIA